MLQLHNAVLLLCMLQAKPDCLQCCCWWCLSALTSEASMFLRQAFLPFLLVFVLGPPMASYCVRRIRAMDRRAGDGNLRAAGGVMVLGRLNHNGAVKTYDASELFGLWPARKDLSSSSCHLPMLLTAADCPFSSAFFCTAQKPNSTATCQPNRSRNASTCCN